MIALLIRSLFFGSLLVLMLDAIVFIAIKVNYFDYYEITEFYNVIFIDAQNLWLFFGASLLLGYLFFDSVMGKFMQIFYVVLLLGAMVTFYEPLGQTIAHQLFYHEDARLNIDNRHEVMADVYYVGRNYIYFKEKSGFQIEKMELARVRADFLKEKSAAALDAEVTQD